MATQLIPVALMEKNDAPYCHGSAAINNTTYCSSGAAYNNTM
jgi:hypothetical protein